VGLMDNLSLAENIINKKYSVDGKETWEEVAWRVANYVAKGEEQYGKSLFEILERTVEYYKVIVEKMFLPGGRILANAGTGVGNLFNCFYFNIGDSRQDIYGVLSKSAEIFAWGGGTGIEISNLRERGAAIGSTGGKSSGPVSFLELFNLTGDVIQQASRRAAVIGLMDVSHPDIIEFINLKSIPNEFTERVLEEFESNLRAEGLSGGSKHFKVLAKTLVDRQLLHFNISVVLTDAFMEAVENKDPWNLISPSTGEVVSVIDAVELLEIISEHIWENGDPGVLFRDRVDSDNMVPYISEHLGSNPCLDKDTLLLSGDKLQKISDTSAYWDSWITGKKEVIKLITNAGHEVIVTPDHRIMLEDGSFIAAKDTVGKNLAWGLGNRSTDEINSNLELVGFLFGNGFLTGGNFNIFVKISEEGGKEIHDLLELFGFTRQKNDGAYYINKERLEKRLGYSLEFLYLKTFEREIPEYILNGDSTIQASFLRGLFEGNGSCNIDGQLSLKATNIRVINIVQVLLASFGIQSWRRQNKPTAVVRNSRRYVPKGSFNLQIAKTHAIKFKTEIGFISNSKNNKIQVSKYRDEAKLQVEKIIPMGLREVWDFRMLGDVPEFNFANGLIAHNCGEINLLSGEACNLGSINLSSVVINGQIDYELLEKLIRTGVRFLDNVHDVSYNNLEEVNKMSKGLRRIGLGVMGFSDMLAKLKIPYDSDEAINLAEHLSWFLSNFAWMESIVLAVEKGAFPYFDSSAVDLSVVERVFDSEKFPDNFKRDTLINQIREVGLRNVSVTALAPTGSISLISEVNSSIEPFFKLIYKRYITEGVANIPTENFVVSNPIFNLEIDSLKLTEEEKEKVFNYVVENGTVQGCEIISPEIQEVFKTSHDISPDKHIEMQAAWQKYVSNAISKTINCSNDFTVEQIFNLIVTLWKSGVKSSTIYRDRSRMFQILNG